MFRRLKDKIVASIMASAMTSDLRSLQGWERRVFKVMAITFIGLFFYSAGPPFLGTPGVGLRRGMYMLLTLAMIFMLYPSDRRSSRDRVPWWDWLLIALTTVTFGYWIVYFNDIVLRFGMPTTGDVVFGTLAIILSLEATRRVLGWVLVVLGLLFIAYAWGGGYLSGALSHAGFPWEDIAYRLFSMEGIFGVVLDTTARFVVLFVLFGSLMKVLGAGDFFVEFPYALTARFRGGPAKAAVVASGLFGMISGSATANTAATGAFTIPLMKRVGYPPHIAGAIEPAASTGGMFMPPVMGAGVFIMSELIRVPYAEIMKVAFVPAVIYFISVGVMAHLEALKRDLKGVTDEPIENPWAILRRGWVFVVPVIVVIVLMLRAYSPGRAVYWSLVSMMAVYLLREMWTKRGKESPVQILGRGVKAVVEGFEDAARDTLVLGSVVGTVGIILGVIALTGIGFLFATSIMQLTYGLLPLAILIAFLTAYVLGMGMTVTSAYILLAALVAPAMIRMGVDPLAAHMLIFWYSQTSNVSPPVCLAAFVGAGIARANPFQTGFAALRFAAYLIIMPLLFVYSEILMPNGLTWAAAQAMICALIATVPFAAGIMGYLVRPLGWPLRIVLLAAAAGLMFPETVSSILGLVVFVAVWLRELIAHRRELAMSTVAG